MDYAKYVGRVGALAAALGIGTALITTPGIAWADDTGAPSNDTASQNTPDAGATGETGKQNTTPTGTGTTTTTVTTSTTTQGATTTTVGGGSTPQVTFEGSTNTGSIGTTHAVPPSALPSTAQSGQPLLESSPSTVEVTTAAVTPTPIPVTPTATATPTAQQTLASIGASTPHAPGTAAAAAANLLDSSAVPSANATAAGGSTGQVTPRTFAARLAAPNVVDNSVTTNTVQDNTINALVAPALPVPSVPPPSLIDTVLAIPGTIISTALNLITQALAPLIGPGAPADNPILWGILAFVRRQFNETFANSSPVLAPRQTSQDVNDSQVHGTFGATDADGDTLAYTTPTTGLGAPAHGTVAIDQATGTYTYTPTAGYTGQDYFFVTATDDTGAPHIHALGQTHLAAARVDVTVASVVNAPPVVSDLSAPSAPGSDGTVTGTFQVTDEDLNSITVGLAQNGQPTHGTTAFDINRTTGLVTYTYTNTATTAERLHAGLGEIDPDTFTAAVSDGVNAPVTTTIDNVPIGATLIAGPSIPAGNPYLTRVTADGTRAYVASLGDSYSAMSSLLAFNVDPTSGTYPTMIGAPIPLRTNVVSYALTPDGTRAYVSGQNTDATGSVVVVDINPSSDTYNTVIGEPIPIGNVPNTIVITPAGTRAYVYNLNPMGSNGGFSDPSVYVLDIDPTSDTYNTVIGEPIAITVADSYGDELALSPDGKRLYAITNHFNGSNMTDRSNLTVIDTDPTSTNFNNVIGEYQVPHGLLLNMIFTADGKRAYASDYFTNSVVILDTDPASPTYGTVIGEPISAPAGPYDQELSLDESVLYVLSLGGNQTTGYLTVIDTSTNTYIGNPIPIAYVDTVDVGPDGTVYITTVTPDGVTPGYLIPFKVTPTTV